MLGRIDPEKRIEDAIRGVAAASEAHTLVVRGTPSYGDSGYYRQVLEMGESLLGDRFKIQSRVPSDRVFDGIDAVIVCNPREPSGRIVAEAQAAGVPVIVPDEGGAAEFVTNGEDGLKYISGDVISLAETLKFMTSESTRIQLSSRGREKARSDYDPAAQAKKYADQILGAVRRSEQ
ncbi:glycosyltransferase family 4 protein [Nocardioidaceae bacterium]|nr:glycosyltransferase family 4 protein [Nocardioidaceae bacterium]